MSARAAPLALVLALTLCVPKTTAQQEPAVQTVTPDTFARAETDRYFAEFVREGAFGKLAHSRELVDVEHQTVVRSNRDTLYSRGVFDLDAGPVTVTLPAVNGRFMSLLVVSEDHYMPATLYAPGTLQVTRALAGTRYAALLVRTFVDPGDPKDLQAAQAAQDGIGVEQTAPGRFETPLWDTASLDRVRDELDRAPGFDPRKAFGRREDVDPEAHRIGAARGWGGNPAKDAIYASATPAANDGKTVHRLTVRDVPVDGFWSVSVYDKSGFFAPNPQHAYSLNNVTARRGADGSYVIQFGSCDGVANCLPITPGWNYTVRLYRPRAEILDGRWAFPKAEPAG